MRPTARLLNSLSPHRATTIGFVGLGRMGYNMAINLFTKSLTAHKTSPGSEVNALTGKLMSPVGRVRTGRPPAFVVCDVNEDAAKAILRNMRDKFPDVKIVVAKNPAELAIFSN